MNTYATSLYGSNTWEIFSKDCEKLYSSFNVAVRQIINLDRCTHRYLIEELSECLHLKTMIASRYVTFYKSLTETIKMPVRFLARISEFDHRTVLRRTLSRLLVSTGSTLNDPRLLTPSSVKKSLRYWPVPAEENWRNPICKEFINVIGGSLELPGFSIEERQEMLRCLCVS